MEILIHWAPPERLHRWLPRPCLPWFQPCGSHRPAEAAPALLLGSHTASTGAAASEPRGGRAGGGIAASKCYLGLKVGNNVLTVQKSPRGVPVAWDAV